MADKSVGQSHNSYREGGEKKADQKMQRLPKPGPGRSRADEHKGQGAEGFSHGYGGSAGTGATEASGPDDSTQDSSVKERGP